MFSNLGCQDIKEQAVLFKPQGNRPREAYVKGQGSSKVAFNETMQFLAPLHIRSMFCVDTIQYID